jgi:hypothetical protein
VPFQLGVFYATEGFRDTFYNDEGVFNIPKAVSFEQMRRDKIRKVYKELLNRFYNISITDNDDMVYPITDQKTGLTRYYKITIDKRFVDIRYNGLRLPKLDRNTVCSKTLAIIDIDELQQLLPLEQFSMEGFAIWHVEDITEEHVLSDIKSTILTAPGREDNETYLLLENAIQTLIGNNDIEVAMLPVLRINNKVVLEDVINSGRSLLLKSLSSFDNLQKCYNDALDQCSTEMEPLIFPNITDEDVK